MQDNQKLSEILDSSPLRQLGADLHNLLKEILSVAWLLNGADSGHCPKINDHIFHDTLLQLGCRLVYFSPLGGPRPTSHLENVVHLGLTAFIVTFLRGLDHRIADMPLLSHLVRSATQGPFGNEKESQEVLLWLLFIGGASIFRQPDDVWLIPKTTQTMDALDLHTWEDVTGTLSKFPWVHAIHDKTCQWHRLPFCHRSLTKISRK